MPAVGTAIAVWWGKLTIVGKIIFVASVLMTIGSAVMSANAQRKAKQAIKDSQYIQTTVRDALLPRPYVYGRRIVSGQLAYFTERGERREWLYLVIVIASHEIDAFEKLYFDDEEVTLAGNAAQGKWLDKAYVNLHRGEPSQAADSMLLADLGSDWSADHKLSGCAYIACKLKFEAELWTNGLPNVKALIRGKKILDPRDNVTRYSNNLGLILNDYLTDTYIGCGIPSSAISQPDLIECANLCDEAVPLDGGGTEPRYSGCPYIDSGTSKEENISQILAAMHGTLAHSGGLWRIRGGAWRDPVMDLSKNDLTGTLSVRARSSRREIFNTIKGTFISENDTFLEREFPTIKNALYKAEDGGEEILSTQQYHCVTSPAQAQRLAKISLERVRQQVAFSGQFGPHVIGLAPGDVITFTDADLGWDYKYFEVVGFKLTITPENDASALSVDLDLKETAPWVYDWNANETEVDYSPDTNLPNPFNAIAPTSLAVSGDSFMQSDGSLAVGALLTWTAPLDQYVLSGGAILIEYKTAASANWIPFGEVSGASTRALITSIKANQAYDYRIRSRNYTGVMSAWLAATATVWGDTAAPATVTGLTATAGTGRVVQVKWTANTEADLWEYYVYRNTVNNSGTASLVAQVGSNVFVDTSVAIGGTYYYWVRASDASDNLGGISGVAAVTVTGVGSGSIDQTAPSAPGAITISTQGSYITNDGSSLSFADVNVPALPSGAVGQNVLIRSDSSAEWQIVSQLTNTSSVRVRIDDLSPNKMYFLGLIAFSFAGVVSSITSSSPSSFTTAADTTAPAVPSGLVASSPTPQDGVPAAYLGSSLRFAALFSWAAVSDKDLAGYEWQHEYTGGSIISQGKVAPSALKIYTYTDVYFVGSFKVRSFDRSGNYSAWASVSAGGWTRAYAGNLGVQNYDDTQLSGIKTGASGASSTQKVLARYPFVQGFGPGPTGAYSWSVNVNLSNRGFSTRPDVVTSYVGNFSGLAARYYAPESGNTSSNAVVTLTATNGSLLPDGIYIDLIGEAIEYD